MRQRPKNYVMIYLKRYVQGDFAVIVMTQERVFERRGKEGTGTKKDAEELGTKAEG